MVVGFGVSILIGVLCGIIIEDRMASLGMTVALVLIWTVIWGAM